MVAKLLHHLLKLVNNSLGKIKMPDLDFDINKYFKSSDKKTKLAFFFSGLGILVFLLIVTVAPFRDGLFSLLFPKPSSHAAVPTDWTQIQHDAQHTGRTTAFVDPPYETAWVWIDKTHIRNATSPYGPFVSGVNKSITDGFEPGFKNTVIFAHDVQPITANGFTYFGAMNGTMYAVDSLTGDNKWDFSSGAAILNTAAVDQGILVFCSMDNKVYGLDATTGAKKWEYVTGGGISAPPIISNGVIYVGSRDGSFYALDLLTGAKKWSYDTRVEPANSNSPYNKAPIISAAALSEDGSVVYFGAENMFFYALNTSDGSEKWAPKKLQGISFQNSWPVVKSGKVIVRTENATFGAEYAEQTEMGPVDEMLDTLCAKDATTGKCTKDPDWQTEEKPTWLNYLSAHPEQKTMYVFDAATGNEPYQVAMGRVTGTNLVPYLPVVDNLDRLLTYWRSTRTSFFKDGPAYGTPLHCPDMSAMDLNTGDRIRLPGPMTLNFCPELDNGFQPTVGGNYLYLYQPFRGLKVVNMANNNQLTAVTWPIAVWDCGNQRNNTQIIYYGNDSEQNGCTSFLGTADPRPPNIYHPTWGIEGTAIATTGTQTMLYVNESYSAAIVGIRHQVGTPSPTPNATATPAPSPSSTPAPTGSGTQVTVQINSSGNDVNESDSIFVTTTPTTRFGGCGAPTICIAGLRFNNVTVPKNAVITSAQLSIFSPTTQWIQTDYSFYGEAIGNSTAFSSSSKPSQKTLTTASVTHSDNVQWLASTTYSLDDIKSIVQEIVNRSDWTSGNSLSLIIKAATPTGFGGKTIQSFDGIATQSAKLIINYQ